MRQNINESRPGPKTVWDNPDGLIYPEFSGEGVNGKIRFWNLVEELSGVGEEGNRLAGAVRIKVLGNPSFAEVGEGIDLSAMAAWRAADKGLQVLRDMRDGKEVKLRKILASGPSSRWEDRKKIIEQYGGSVGFNDLVHKLTNVKTDNNPDYGPRLAEALITWVEGRTIRGMGRDLSVHLREAFKILDALVLDQDISVPRLGLESSVNYESLIQDCGGVDTCRAFLDELAWIGWPQDTRYAELAAIVRNRLGLAGPSKTLEEIGVILSLTREGVRLKEAKGIELLLRLARGEAVGPLKNRGQRGKDRQKRKSAK